MATERKKPGILRYLFLAILLVVAGGVLLPGSPLSGWVISRALAIKFSDIRRVTPAELVTWTKDPSRPPPLLIDARTDAEYKVSHLADAVRIDPTAPDLAVLANVRKDQPMVIYCSVGLRSTALAVALQQAGYTGVFNLEGGLFRWANEGRPLSKAEGPATVVHPYNHWIGYMLEKRYRAEGYSDVSSQP